MISDEERQARKKAIEDAKIKRHYYEADRWHLDVEMFAQEVWDAAIRHERAKYFEPTITREVGDELRKM